MCSKHSQDLLGVRKQKERLGRESSDQKAEPKWIHDHRGGIKNTLNCAILTLGLLQGVVGQSEKAGTWLQGPDHGSKLVVRCTEMCAGANLGSRRSKTTLVWLQAQLGLGAFHSIFLFLCFLGGWESGSGAVGLAHPARSGAPCLLKTEGSPRGVSTAALQHLETPSRSPLRSQFLPSTKDSPLASSFF